jgi:hypothetical protein
MGIGIAIRKGALVFSRTSTKTCHKQKGRLAETAALLKAATKKMAIQRRMVPSRIPMKTAKWTTLQALATMRLRPDGTC